MSVPASERVHATCVALRAKRGWRGVLLRGASGAGKSDLALRLIEDGARLAADDQTEIVPVAGRLIATAPTTIAGLIEVRGLGIVRLPRDQLVARVPLALLVDLVPGRQIERLPEARHECLLGVTLPVVAVAPFEPSAPAKLRLAFRQFAVA